MPGPVDLKEFLAGFLIETDEHLHTVNRNLVAVAAALKAERPEPRAVRELFRSLHTIKGLASMVGVEPIVDISHAMEGILRTADGAGGRLSDHALDLLLKGTRAVEERVHAISKGGVGAVAPAPQPLLEAFTLAQTTDAELGGRPPIELSLPDEVMRSLTASDREQVVQAAHLGHRVVLVEFQPSADRAARGLNITAARTRLARLGEIVKVLPRSSAGAPTGIAFGLLLVTDAADPMIAEAIDASPEVVQSVVVIRPETPSLAEEAAAEPGPAAEWVRSDYSIRVDVRRLDDALEQLSALVVTRFKMARAVAELGARGADIRELNTIIAENTRQLRRLRAAITQARMVPLADLLQRLPLVVRGLTKDSGKSVNIDIQAGSAEVDKAVADRLFPVLVHLVRNAVDHALEPRDERLNARKAETGTLTIRCDEASGTNLLLEIADDGRGIDRQAVATRLGRPPAATDAELLQQIATPGLSTRDEITHTSGRGMGMDIVKRTVETLGGSVTLRSSRGVGTTFALRVPVSITIMDVFSFSCGNQVFVTPVATVEEIIEVDAARLVRSPAPRRDTVLPGLVQRRGEAIPLFALEALLAQQNRGAVPAKALVVRQSSGTVAFGVDRMLGQQEAVVRPLDDALIRVPGVTGATDLGDGLPTLVLDLATLHITSLHDGASP